MSVCRRRRAAEFCRGYLHTLGVCNAIPFCASYSFLLAFFSLSSLAGLPSRNPTAIRAFGKEGSRVLKACLHENIFRPLPRCIITLRMVCVDNGSSFDRRFPPNSHSPSTPTPTHIHTDTVQYSRAVRIHTHTLTHSRTHTNLSCTPPSPWFSFPNPSSFPPPHPPFLSITTHTHFWRPGPGIFNWHRGVSQPLNLHRDLPPMSRLHYPHLVYYSTFVGFFAEPYTFTVLLLAFECAIISSSSFVHYEQIQI